MRSSKTSCLSTSSLTCPRSSTVLLDHSVYELETSERKPFEDSFPPTCPGASKLLQSPSADDLKSSKTSRHIISEKFTRSYEDILPTDSIQFSSIVFSDHWTSKNIFVGQKNQKLTLLSCDSSPLDAHACNRPYIFFYHAVSRAQG